MQHEHPVRVSDLDFILCIRLLDPPILLASTFLPRLPGCRATSKHSAHLAPTNALKTGAHATPHTAPQPLIGVDPVC